MRSPHLESIGVLLAVLVGSEVQAQAPPFNTSLVGRFQEPLSLYGDVWADGDVVYLGRFGQAAVDVVSVADPANPVLLATFDVPPPDDGASAQDVKAGDGLLFVALADALPNGALVVDVRDPANPTLLTTIDAEPGAFEKIHNLFYEGGWLYLCNSEDDEIAILDLRGYDPDAPPASVDTWDYLVQTVGDFVHDVTVQNGRLYAATWTGLDVYDVSNLGSGPPTLLGSVQGFNCHQSWATQDGRFVVTAEERAGGSMRLYEVVDSGSSLRFLPRDSFQVSPSEAYSLHNSLVRGDRIYSSWYQAGLRVHEIDRTSKTLELVATFDTSVLAPFGFAGCWGVYPFEGTDRILLSDTQEGLFVVDASALEISFAGPRPRAAGPGVAKTVTVDVEALGSAVLDPGSPALLARVNGGPFVRWPMAPLGGGRFQGALPPAGCDVAVEWYVEVADAGGAAYADPVDAPASVHTLWTTRTLVPLFVDDFEDDEGWAVTNTNVSSGAWTRGDPVASGAQPEEGDPDAEGRSCYVTGNGTPGGPVGEADLDGGPTVLTSPTLDFSAGDGVVRFSAWLFSGTGDDELLVEISDDGGASWETLERLVHGAGGWVERTFRVSDRVTPTANVVVRFTVSDFPNDSITEAGLDQFRALRFTCTSAAMVAVRNGTGVNPLVLSSTAPPSLGSTWTAEVDAGGVPGAFLSSLFGFERPLPPGVLIGPGELLVDVSSPLLFLDTETPDAAGLATHALALPSSPVFQGFELHVQGLISAPGVPLLTNALRLQLDY